MAEKKIMRKIAALFAKTVANGATEEEALAAAQMAQKLIAQYHVDLDAAMNDEEIKREDLRVTRQWQQMLATIIARNMCCRVIALSEKGKSFAVFYGRDTDREAAIKSFEMMSAVCKKGIRREKAIAREIFGSFQGVEKAYAMSFVKAVNAELSRQCTALALVVPLEVNEKVHKDFPKLYSYSMRPNVYRKNMKDMIFHAKEIGQRDGHEVAERRGIDSSPRLLGN